MYISELMQKVQFQNGTFTPSEARDVISKVIDDQIAFYKLRHLSHWVKDNTIDPNLLEDKIAQLRQQKRELMEMVKEAKLTGNQLSICGEFKINIER